MKNGDSLTQPKVHVPEWVKTAVFYEIYPQSFYDTNADGIGDLEGIIQKLDYLQALGITALWINPCFDSPFNDAGYDVRDFYKIAPRYGTNDDMRRLCREADRRGIKVCLDLVAPHTSIDHPWFIESCRHGQNKYTNRFIWSGSMYRMPVWQGKEQPALQGYGEREGAVAVNFFWSQPKLNYGLADPDPKCSYQLPYDHPDVQALWKEMQDIIRFWLDMGVSGYRCDSAKSICGAPANTPEGTRFWRETHAMLARDYPDAALFCEWGYPMDSVKAGFAGNLLMHNMKAYTSLFVQPEWENGYCTPMFDEAGGNAEEFLAQFMPHFEVVQQHGGFMGLPTGNHDCTRIATGRSEELMKTVFAFLLTMPGVPFIYYGDEIGMQQQWGIKSVEGGYRRCACRTPMQWDKTANAGFSPAAPENLYLPLDPNPQRPTVAEKAGSADSSLNILRKLTALRRENRALDADADFSILHSSGGAAPFVFRRAKAGQEIVIAINPVADPRAVDLKGCKADKQPELLCGTAGGRFVCGENAGRVELPGVSFGIWLV